jgi:anthraniloyl-CoA monooxygenase
VLERNQADSTFGWGIVFSDRTMDGFRADDPQVVAEIERNFHHWDNCDVFFKGRRIISGGHGYCGIGRLKLLQIFQARARELGVNLKFETEFKDPDDYSREYDLVIGADGVNSLTTRAKYAEHFNPRIDVRKCRFIWLGTKKKLNAFTFAFKQTGAGWFNLHAYQFNEEWATFIVETPEETWLKAGIDKMDPDQSIAFCEELFADMLDGARLISNARHLRGSAVWLKFNRVLCERWFKDNIVLLGDAAHTAHFSIGSGTKLAMEDAAALVKVLNSTDGDVPARLARYQAEREIEALKLQSAARNRMTWFEEVDHYVDMEPDQFAFALLTGSQRVGHANQKLRDPAYTEDYDRWFAARCGVPTLRPRNAAAADVHAVQVARHVLVQPRRGLADVHLFGDRRHARRLPFPALHGTRPRRRGAGDDRDDLRIRRCPHHAGLRRHLERRADGRLEAHRVFRPCQQPGEDGAADRPCRAQGFDQAGLGRHRPAAPRRQLAADCAPSALPYIAGTSQVPREMTRADMDRVKADFVAATRRAASADFDMVEFHAAHGYLMSSFISPLTNRRSDEYGGSLEKRCRYPLEVFKAMREAWPADKPMSVRISAHDWAPGGTTPGRRNAGGQTVPGRRRRHHPRLLRPGGQGRAAGVWPHVPGTLLRPDPQRTGCADRRRGQHLRGRPRQHHHRRRSRRPLRARPPASGGSGLDPACGGRAGREGCGLAQTVSGRKGSARTQPRARGPTRAECLRPV